MINDTFTWWWFAQKSHTRPIGYFIFHCLDQLVAYPISYNLKCYHCIWIHTRFRLSLCIGNGYWPVFRSEELSAGTIEIALVSPRWCRGVWLRRQFSHSTSAGLHADGVELSCNSSPSWQKFGDAKVRIPSYKYRYPKKYNCSVFLLENP